MLRRLIKVSAAVAGVGLVVAGCSGPGPLKMGAAAIVGNQRITIATLDAEVTNLSAAASRYPGVITLSPQQMTDQTLTWLIRFQINEEVASRAGITVTPAQAQQALAQTYEAAAANAEAAGVTNPTPTLILAANGIPPDQAAELGRYVAIQTQYAKALNGGTLPTSASAQAATTAKLAHAQCLAAKALNVQVNPQFGRMDYSQYQVVPSLPLVWRSSGPAASSSLQGLAPAC